MEIMEAGVGCGGGIENLSLRRYLPESSCLVSTEGSVNVLSSDYTKSSEKFKFLTKN